MEYRQYRFLVQVDAKMAAHQLHTFTNDITKVINFSRRNKIKISFIGSGSNVLASDSGFNGIIITLKKVLNEIVLSSSVFEIMFCSRIS